MTLSVMILKMESTLLCYWVDGNAVAPTAHVQYSLECYTFGQRNSAGKVSDFPLIKCYVAIIAMLEFSRIIRSGI